MGTMRAMAALALSLAPTFKVYDARADGFRVEFPGMPEIKSNELKGSVWRTHTVEMAFGSYSVQVLSDAEISPAASQELVDALRRVKSLYGEITSDRPVTLGSLHGVELKTREKEVDGVTRMFVTKGRWYTVSVDAKPGHSLAELQADRFLSSFAIVEAKALEGK